MTADYQFAALAAGTETAGGDEAAWRAWVGVKVTENQIERSEFVAESHGLCLYTRVASVADGGMQCAYSRGPLPCDMT